jgi:phosphoribosylaminoimidazolecarboxamide formyltransferase / IMP cyclohydrolase
MELRYGMNPQQATAHATPVTPGSWPVRVLNGQPSLINMLDALNGWQLVREAGQLLGRPAAASFKHTSPAGAALSGPVDEVTAGLYGPDNVSDGTVTSAYLRARDADPKSSYGDFAAVSSPVDASLARTLAGVVCDGIIAPGYEPGTVAQLSRKKNGSFLIIEADPAFSPPARESREVFGVRLTQDADTTRISRDTLGPARAGEPLPEKAVDDVLLGLVVLRYTQSNSVCYARAGMTLGIGAGQQSRVDCTRLAGAKTDTWWLRRHPAIQALSFAPHVRRQDKINWQFRLIEGDLTAAERAQLTTVLTRPAAELTPDQRAAWLRRLTGVAFVSDGYLPFRDNVEHASRHGVSYVAEPGGSARSDEIADACAEYGISLVRTGLRLFHHLPDAVTVTPEMAAW